MTFARVPTQRDEGREEERFGEIKVIANAQSGLGAVARLSVSRVGL